MPATNFPTVRFVTGKNGRLEVDGFPIRCVTDVQIESHGMNPAKVTVTFDAYLDCGDDRATQSTDPIAKPITNIVPTASPSMIRHLSS